MNGNPQLEKEININQNVNLTKTKNSIIYSQNELLNSNWLVVNTNDSQPIIFNNNRSSFESINFNIDFRDILNTRYDFLQSYGAFRIYHQKAINNNFKS